MDELVQISPLTSPSGVRPKEEAKRRVPGERRGNDEDMLATAMTEVTEENENLLRELEERCRHADVEPHNGGCTAQMVPYLWEQLGDCDLCHGDIQHRVVLTCGMFKTLVGATRCRWEKRESSEKQDLRPRRRPGASSHPPAFRGGFQILGTGSPPVCLCFSACLWSRVGWPRSDG